MHTVVRVERKDVAEVEGSPLEEEHCMDDVEH